MITSKNTTFVGIISRYHQQFIHEIFTAKLLWLGIEFQIMAYSRYKCVQNPIDLNLSWRMFNLPLKFYQAKWQSQNEFIKTCLAHVSNINDSHLFPYQNHVWTDWKKKLFRKKEKMIIRYKNCILLHFRVNQ